MNNHQCSERTITCMYNTRHKQTKTNFFWELNKCYTCTLYTIIMHLCIYAYVCGTTVCIGSTHVPHVCVHNTFLGKYRTFWRYLSMVLIFCMVEPYEGVYCNTVNTLHDIHNMYMSITCTYMYQVVMWCVCTDGKVMNWLRSTKVEGTTLNTPYLFFSIK